MPGAVKQARTVVALLLLTTTTVIASDWDRSVALYNKGDFRSALAEFQDIVKERPDAAGAWYYIGLCEFKLKRYNKVELPLSHAIDLLQIQSPESADIAGAWYTIGISHFLLNEFDKTIDPLKKYVDLTTRAKKDVDPSARSALARAYFFLERYEDALPLLASNREKSASGDKNAERIKDAAANNYYLGVIYFKREDDDHAIQALHEAINGNPGDAAALELLAESLMRKARKASGASNAAWVEAGEIGEKLKLIRDDDKTASILGRAYLGAKMFEKAVPPLEKLAKANPENGQAWLYFGIALSRSGQMRRAMEALEITIQLVPDSTPALLELGYVYESDKQYQQALRIYQKAYATNSDPGIKETIERVRTLASQQP
jgi:tetratricopeptide (TPR) repeat protein